MTKAEIEAQVEIIRGSVFAYTSHQKISPANSLSTATLPAELDNISPLTQSELAEEAMKIAQEISRRAIWSEADSATWLGLFAPPENSCCQFRPMEHGFYSGHCGLALFFAALAKVSAGAGFRELALAALQPLRQDLRSENAGELLAPYKAGGWDGWGFMVYALVTISQWLEDTRLIKDARLISGWANSGQIEVDALALADITGSIVGSLALYEATLEDQYLEQAQGWAELILEKQAVKRFDSNIASESQTEYVQKSLSRDDLLAIRALNRLYQLTLQKRYLQTDCKLAFFATNDTLANPVKADHFDSATLLNLALNFPQEFNKNELRLQLKTSFETGWPDADQIWDGGFGEIDLLLAAASQLELPELAEVARQRAAGLVRRARQTGGYRLFANLPTEAYSPALFKGTAGIGYQLLRLAYPDQLPLLWPIHSKR